MNLSPAGRAFLEAREGVALKCYPDSCKIPTVGIGHRVLPQDHLVIGDIITQDQAEAFFTADLARSELAINNNVIPELTQNQFDALVSLTWNIGVAGFDSSTVLRVINGSGEKPLEDAWCMWDKDVQHGAKVTDPALLARRKLEVALYMTPDSTDNA
jgi:lysozyme